MKKDLNFFNQVLLYILLPKWLYESVMDIYAKNRGW